MTSGDSSVLDREEESLATGAKLEKRKQTTFSKGTALKDAVVEGRRIEVLSGIRKTSPRFPCPHMNEELLSEGAQVSLACPSSMREAPDISLFTFPPQIRNK